jgi:hypothetical protein
MASRMPQRLIAGQRRLLPQEEQFESPLATYAKYVRPSLQRSAHIEVFRSYYDFLALLYMLKLRKKVDSRGSGDH